MTSKQIKAISPVLAFGIFMLYFPLYGNGAVTPAIAALSAAFPDADITIITLINTMPNLTTIFGCLLVPIIVAKHNVYKQLGIAAMLIYGVFGCLPFFWNSSVEVILIGRALCGLGIGLLFPLGAAVLLNTIANIQERAKYLGWGQAVGQIGCVALTLAGGFLCAISWQYTFLAYVIPLICMVFFIFTFKNPETNVAGEQEEQLDGIASTPDSKTLPPFGWALFVLFMLYQMFYSPAIMLLSPLMAQAAGGADVSAMASILLSLLTVAGAVGAACCAPLHKVLGKFTGPVAMAVAGAVGCSLIAFGTNDIMFGIGICTTGFAFSVIMPMMLVEIGNWATAAALAMVSTVTMIGTNFGNFLSSYWLGFLTSLGFGLNFPVIMSAVLITTLAIIWAIMNVFNKAYKKGDNK